MCYLRFASSSQNWIFLFFFFFNKCFLRIYCMQSWALWKTRAPKEGTYLPPHTLSALDTYNSCVEQKSEGFHEEFPSACSAAPRALAGVGGWWSSWGSNHKAEPQCMAHCPLTIRNGPWVVFYFL